MLQLDHGQIVFRRAADVIGSNRILAGIELHDYFAGILDDVKIGDDMPGAIPDKSAAGALCHAGGE